MTTKARNCPTTIASSLRPVIDPRISNGASSARYTGTTVEAPPTASPRMIRPATRISKPGEKTTNSTPTKNMTARTMIVFLRPIASEILPPMRAPTAAANTSELMTMPSLEERTARVRWPSGLRHRWTRRCRSRTAGRRGRRRSRSGRSVCGTGPRSDGGSSASGTAAACVVMHGLLFFSGGDRRCRKAHPMMVSRITDKGTVRHTCHSSAEFSLAGSPPASHVIRWFAREFHDARGRLSVAQHERPAALTRRSMVSSGKHRRSRVQRLSSAMICATDRRVRAREPRGRRAVGRRPSGGSRVVAAGRCGTAASHSSRSG